MKLYKNTKIYEHFIGGQRCAAAAAARVLFKLQNVPLAGRLARRLAVNNSLRCAVKVASFSLSLVASKSFGSL